MELFVDAGALARALAESVAGGRHTLEILQHVLLCAQGETLGVISTDLECTVERRVPADVRAPGTCTADAALLAATCKGVRGHVGLRADDPLAPALAVTVPGRVRAAHYDVPALNPQDWPQPDAPGDVRPLPLAAADLARLFRRGAYAAAVQDVRYYLNGVCLTGAAVMASDGHRGAYLPTGLPAGADVPECIVPGRTLARVLKALTWEGAQVAVEMLRDDNRAAALRVTAADGALAVKLIDGKFPDLKRMVPAEAGCPAAVGLRAGDLLEACGRMRAFVDSRRGSRGHGGAHYPVVLAIDEGALRLSSGDGRNREFVDVLSLRGVVPMVGVNLLYLEEVAKLVGGEAQICLHLRTPQDALLITCDGADEAHVVMPMRF